MSFSGNTNLPQPEEGDDLTTQSSYTSTEGLSVDCATPVDGATTRPSPASPDLIGISLSLGQKEESPWELSSSSGESVHSTTRYDIGIGTIYGVIQCGISNAAVGYRANRFDILY